MADTPKWYDSKKRYNIEYTRTHYSRVVLNVPPEVKAELQNRAAADGLSLTQYILKKALA